MTIAITGATGQLGRLAIEKLKAGVPAAGIVALARSPAKAAGLGVAVREADYARPETLASALSGVDTLLLISSSEIGRRVVQHRNAIGAAKEAGVGRIAYTSLLHADTSPLDLAEEHRATEAELRASGIPHTILRNGWYTENHTGSIGGALAGGAVIGSAGNGRISSAPRADYAEAAVAVLTGEGHEGKTYELAGDDAYTLADLAAEISRQTGRTIPYKDLPEGGLRRRAGRLRPAGRAGEGDRGLGRRRRVEGRAVRRWAPTLQPDRAADHAAVGRCGRRARRAQVDGRRQARRTPARLPPAAQTRRPLPAQPCALPAPAADDGQKARPPFHSRAQDPYQAGRDQRTGGTTMALHTRICDVLGVRFPILLAGMGRASTPELAAAVSNAGGLGVLGAAACGPNQLRDWIRRTRELTDKPFGVDTLLPASVRRAGTNAGGPSAEDLLPEHRRFARDVLRAEGLPELDAAALDELGGRHPADRGGPRPLSREFFEAQMEVVVAERVPVYAAGLGNPGLWMEPLKRNGTVVLAVVGTTRHAAQVAAAGVDIVVAQGHDGGGHNSPVGTMALIPQVVDAVAGRGVPVVGAGGIGDGRGVAAALMLGAEGAWIGTAFLATEEAGISGPQKQALVEGNDEGTTVSRSVTGKPARMLKNRWAQAYADSGLEPLPMPHQSAVSLPVTAAATAAGRADVWGGFAGQGLGMVRAVRPAAEVLRDIVEGAERALERAPGLART
jgi:NAD(P)H-dependent flavin oxidoreductase YrpB (nitropropane dioxygenase family)/uncharacterized protein YbjT (DUF2867 family)